MPCWGWKSGCPEPEKVCCFWTPIEHRVKTECWPAVFPYPHFSDVLHFSTIFFLESIRASNRLARNLDYLDKSFFKSFQILIEKLLNPLFLGFPEFRGCLKKSFVFSKGIPFEKKIFFYSSIRNYEILKKEAKKCSRPTVLETRAKLSLRNVGLKQSLFFVM